MWVQLPPLPLSFRLTLDNDPNKRYNRAMTIDTNTVVLLTVSAVAGFFAVAYFRMKINEKFTAMQRHHEDNVAEIYQSFDKLWREIHGLEKKVECCRASKQQTCEKNYYNSQS